MTVVLLGDPLERSPPASQLVFAADGGRVALDLSMPGQRAAWARAFEGPVAAALEQLPARGVRVHVLSTDAPSDAWIGPSRQVPARVA